MRRISKEELENIKATAAQMEEKQRRQYLYRVAESLGKGGITYIARKLHISPATLIKAKRELLTNNEWKKGDRNRAKGSGRKKTTEKIANIKEIIAGIIESSTYGTPSKILKWTTLSLRKIADLLYENYKIKVSHPVISKILKELGYSRQKNKKAEQVGAPDPDRNTQFEFIDKLSYEFISNNEPVISVDTKKKENIGNFSNNGTEWRKKGDPRRTLDHDFPIEELGKVSPYGIYCLNNNTGFVNLGISHDTSEFAMNSIYLWWIYVGKETFPNAKRILITCDCGGSNRSKGQMWKEQMFMFSLLTGLTVYISHFPTGCSKWNKIEHRMFAYISKSWQGRPLIDIETTIELIGSTTTTTGLKIKCVLDDHEYELNKKLFSKEKFKALPIQANGELGKWNYIIDGKISGLNAYDLYFK